MTPLDIALKWAAEGFRVFPSCPNSKKPLRKGWKEHASDLEFDIMATFEGLPDTTNVLMVIPSDIIVVDLDVKGSENGVANWDDKCQENGINHYSDTLVVQTPSGGEHIYYRVDKPVAITQGAIAPGIDTRTTDIRDGATSRESYTLAPGNPGYEVIRPNDIAPLPEFVYPLAQPKGRTGKMEFTADDLANYDWIEDQDEISAIMADTFKEKFEDSQRDGQITKFAGAAYVRGICPDALAEAILDKLAEDGWGSQDEDTVAKCIESIYKNANEVPGLHRDENVRENSLSAIAGLAPDAEPVPSKFKQLTFSDMKAMEPPRWLVKGMIPKASLGVLVAPSGSKKTFAALDLAMTMATDGDEWNGRKLNGNKVLFAAGEGARGIYRRMVGWMKHNSVNDVGDGLRLVDTVPTHEAHELVEFVSQDDEWVPDLVVIDTISYASLGLEENSASDMMQLVANYRAAVHGKWPEATVLFIGHARKDAKGGDGTKLRGSGAVYGAADFMLGLEEQDQAIVLRTTKIKDGAAIGEKMAFRAKEIEIGRDEDDDPVTTLVMPWCDVPIDEDKLPNPSTMSWDTMDRTQQVRAAAFVALSNMEPNTHASFKEIATEVKHLFIERQGQNEDMLVEDGEMDQRMRALRKILSPKSRTVEDAQFIEPRIAVEADTAPGLVFVGVPGRSMYDALFDGPNGDEE